MPPKNCCEKVAFDFYDKLHTAVLALMDGLEDDKKVMPPPAFAMFEAGTIGAVSAILLAFVEKGSDMREVCEKFNIPEHWRDRITEAAVEAFDENPS